MSTSIRKKTGGASSRYHHGNLRQALLEAALTLVASGEERSLSLRTVAARAGVSSAAPYRHFEDHAALRAAIAAIGFDRLLEAIVKARTSAKGGSRLAAMALAYLTFAAKNRGLYQMMFTENHQAIRFDETLAKSSTAAFVELENAVRSRLTRPGEGNANLVATTLWASLHGVAMLSFERLIPAGGPCSDTEAARIGTAVAQLLIDRLF